MPQSLEFVVPCLLGLEGLVAGELRRLNLSDVQAENGRVFCRGAVADIPRLNLNLRTGARVMLVAGRFPAPTFDALFEGTKAIPWEDYIRLGDSFPVKGYTIDSALHAVSASQSIVKKAVCARLGAKYGLEVLPETGPVHQIRFAIQKDEAVLMLDTSGEGLFKRGYRAVGVEAPLRETLAAAMVTLSRYRGRDPFRDPFCGSGTIAIEAALIAKNRAPGLERSFAAQKWGWVPSQLWMDAADEAISKEFDGEYDILGSDIDPRAVEIARSNAVKAGVEDMVRFEVADARAFSVSSPRGRIVTNPPYGERLMEKSEAEELYRAFGRTYAALPPDWELYLLSSHTEFERTFGRPADKKRKLYNGMIKCDLFMYHVPDAGKKPRR